MVKELVISLIDPGLKISFILKVIAASFAHPLVQWLVSVIVFRALLVLVYEHVNAPSDPSVHEGVVPWDTRSTAASLEKVKMICPFAGIAVTGVNVTV